ncbi:MAG: translation initiation factor IF-6 [archaeon]|uniref:Translation initiation factor 6 n=1 Tax=Methanobrevibacter gottschalkii DSM 11977 TaxID=1122229 RepID=A0A3N5B6M1_9EURY|nr:MULTISPECIES: translation initiation factor IF-6 [Methanobrevibacter]MCQ2971399.1 translation initiation factor IF-6 [archaeon]OEC99223.1 translation initiation factor IF-6 [Methanobrevibacter sp. A27]RPF53013.1 translation initiation factor 6 (aeIF-6) [Methanobrevibacter gottschalkii DSM 11977]
MLKRVDIVGNPNIGVFILATDEYAIVPYNLLDEKADIIKETLDVDVVKSSISGCSLIGSLAVANSNGMVVSPHVLDREIKQFEDLGINVATVPGQYTALGNIIAANDKGALASPFLSEKAINIIEETLDVNVESTSMVGSDIIGSMIQVTNKGFLISSNAVKSEISFAQEVFGVEGDIGTVGKGISLVGACSIANSKGAIVAKDSTGPEMARVEEALGFLDDDF